MVEFFQICFSFPTVVFTSLLMVVCLYWLLVISGGVGLEILDLDLQIESFIEAGTEGAGGTMARLLAALGFGTIPVTLLGSVFVFTGWIGTFFGTLYLSSLLGGGLIGDLLVFAASLVAAVFATGLVVQPLRPLFRTFDDSGGDSMVGEVCTIQSPSVDARSGRAKYEEGSSDAILSVRCDDDNTLSSGDKALIIGYDDAEHTYRVEPYDDIIGD
jgi:membrane protein implicated in regulation of membrane protease activity